MKKNHTLHMLGLMLMLTAGGFLLTGCEDFEDQTYELSDQEQMICDRLNDTLHVELEGADLRPLGPQWTGADFATSAMTEERIGTSWFDGDHVLEPDVYVFINAADTVGALQFMSMVYDETSGQVDSIRFAYLYNPDGDPSFAGDTKDTLLITGANSSPYYFSFASGAVGSSDAWDLQVSGDMISLGSATRVHRKEDSSLLALNNAPGAGYYADGSGFELVMNLLNADSSWLVKTDSLLMISMDGNVDAAYLVWDRTGSPEGMMSLVASDHMSINLWNSDGDKLSPQSTNISMELIAYCHMAKTVAEYELDGGEYLIQFLAHEAMSEDEFFLSVMEVE